ncbi:hypothetical protein BKA61DRAFT_569563 [Leptodontidium sp. MPI-SDFR-AT-0119]|nr:hypothetical protein BKA61DRAFT_569563 [Leptodontidium sp. MPI-SDFR-AT-0119]
MSKRKISSVQEAELVSNEKSCVTQPLNSTMAPSLPAKNDGKRPKRQNSSLDEEPISNNKRQRTRPPTSPISTTKQRQMKSPYTGSILSMAELVHNFQPLRMSSPLAFKSAPQVKKPVSKKTYISNNSTDIITYKPSPKTTKKKSIKKPEITIFEDETATQAANPSPDEITTDPESRFFEYNDEEAIEYYTSRIRLGTKRVIQKAEMKYATWVIEWLTPLAIHLDAMTPFTDRGFEERDVQEVVTDYMAVGAFCQGDVTQIAKHSDQTLALLVGYCQGFSGGMDIGGPVLGDYLEDGRRNPQFFRRLTAAWTTILALYMEEDFTSCVSTNLMSWHVTWVNTVREKIGGDAINWGLMEHFWGDSFPPCDAMRRFGGEVNREDVFDPYGAERYEMGVDQLMYE